MIVDEIALSNDEGSAIAKISVSTDTNKIEMNVSRKQNRLEVVLTSSYIKPSETSEAVQDFDSLEENETAAIATVLLSSPKKYSGSKKLIIIDPGHGGADPGAVGPDGICEKDVTLSIAKKLKKLLDENGSYETILTRTDDVFIPLVERTNLANEKKADIFVSVHCNASLNKDASGFEIYFLSENASDSEAQATAMLENSVVKLEGKPSEKQMKLQELLWSMTVNEFINESSELSSFIAEEVTHNEKTENRGVKQAGFFVLRGARMPAVLVEAAFISNKKEESNLNKRRFQNEIANFIYNGIKRYEARKSQIEQKESGA